MRYYILHANCTPKKISDAIAWAKWMAENIKARIIAQHEENGFLIRTFFTGVDLEKHRGRPYVFDSYLWRVGEEGPRLTRSFCSYAAAVKGHQEFLEMVRRE